MKGGLKKTSIFEAKHNPDMFSDFKFRRDALQGLYFAVLYCMKYFYINISIFCLFYQLIDIIIIIIIIIISLLYIIHDFV